MLFGLEVSAELCSGISGDIETRRQGRLLPRYTNDIKATALK
jgi:hypothetical protein